MKGLTLKNITKSYGNTQVIHGVDLEVELGEFVVFVGPSGCGKSTLLRMIAGLETITSGDLLIENAKVNQVPAAMRGIAMVFQTYALYPHMTVYDNMAFAMRIAKATKQEIHDRVMDAAKMLQLEPYLDRLPKALSGGQRQRVAIGRAIVRQPKVFLFDEPLSNLDAALRVQTRIEIANLKEQLPKTTMVYVTHDQVEAMTLADRIVVLSAGKIEQVGSPLELYSNPANVFVAQFIGSPAMNILNAQVESTTGSTSDSDEISNAGTEVQSSQGLMVKANHQLGEEWKGQSVQVGVRPEHWHVATEQNGQVKGEIVFIESLGEVTLLHIESNDFEQTLIAKIPGIAQYKKGQTIYLSVLPEDVHLFDLDGKTLK